MNGLTNTRGNYMVIKSENQGRIVLDIYESKATYESHTTTPVEETIPDTTTIHVGNVIDLKKEETTSLEGMNLSERETDLMYDVLVEFFQTNPKLIPKTKFDQSDWTRVTV